MYITFFKTYTEKVWGIPCHQIQADWAAQRIKGLSLTTAIYNALLGVNKAKTLIEEFNYPVKGPGMMWQRFQETIQQMGSHVRLNSNVIKVNHKNAKITHLTYTNCGTTKDLPLDTLISSVPITRLVAMMNPRPPQQVLQAADSLAYRAFIIVVLIIDKKNLFPDQWIYIHSPEVKVGRIQNFKNWSMAMLPDPEKTSIGMEYFCNEGDDLWTMADEALTATASRELAKLGLAEQNDIIDATILRQPKAYPVYDQHYSDHLQLIKEYIQTFDNLTTIGRNGMHRYNNMDHSMLTGMLAVENLTGATHDLWLVNEEEAYLEAEQEKKKITQLLREEFLISTFARMDKLGFATAIGCVTGGITFLATLWLFFTASLQDHAQFKFVTDYFTVYSISIKGTWVALGYNFFWGFIFGWLFAYLRNFFIAVYLFYSKRKAELLSFSDFMGLYR